MHKYSLFILGLLVLLVGCSKDETAPENPFDAITFDVQSIPDSLDPNGIVSIHRDILLPTCGAPGCHDGSFEPDFRTVMSSYSTLVYHPIIKNSPDSLYTYRVVPFDTNSSVFQKRLTYRTFANINDRMPQDNIGTGLPKEDLERISDWILGGAQDPNGNIPTFPNTQPNFNFFWSVEGDPVFLNIFSSPLNVLSSPENRVSNLGHYPMIFDNNMWVAIGVDNIIEDSTDIDDLSNVKLLMSYKKDDFSAPVRVEEGSFIMLENPTWYFNFEVGNQLLTDTTIFLRITANDGDHADDAFFPKPTSFDYYKTLWSFTIQPGSH